MRTKYSIKNSITSIILYVINILIGFVSQTLFIKLLNVEYLGLQNVYINILAIIQIFELGIGNLIIYYLYKPLVEEDTNSINNLLLFYKKWCNGLSIIFVIIGLVLLPFLKYIVGDITININIYMVYILFVISNIIYCFYNYNIVLICTDQKKYIVNIIRIIYITILNLIQIVILIKTKNYYLYLIIKIVFQLIENIFITRLNKKMYPYLSDSGVLDKSLKEKIFKDMKPLVIHKFNTIIVENIDNVLISVFLGIGMVGKYSNYYLLVNYLNAAFCQVIVSVGSSVGNLLVSNNDEKNYKVFKRLSFLNFWLATFSGTMLILVVEPFIEIWLGREYILNTSVLIALVFHHFLRTFSSTYYQFYENSGIWRSDSLSPLLESSLHVIISIVFLKLYGIIGVIIGGIIGNLVLWCYAYPKYVHKNILKNSYQDYLQKTISYFVLFVLIVFVCLGISSGFDNSNVYIKLIINSLIAVFVPNLVLLLIFRKNNNFRYFINLLKGLSFKKW